MGFTYTVLPDGSIFRLKKPSDYVVAAQIIQDEVGDMGDDSGADGGWSRSWVSMSAADGE